MHAPRFGKLSLLAFVVLCTAYAHVLFAEAVDWTLPTYAFRAVFLAPRHAREHVLLTIPSGGKLSQESDFAVRDAAGTHVPHRVVHVDGATVAVLVQLGATDRAREYSLYYRPERCPRPGPAAEPDPQPVCVSLHRSVGRSIPNTWQKVRYLYARSPQPANIFHHHEFGDIDLSSKWQNDAFVRREEERRRSDPRAKWTRKAEHWRRRDGSEIWISRLRSYLLCPTDGIYRFALDCRNAGFLLIDGELRARCVNRYGAPNWYVGPPIFLEAGPHRVDVFSCSDKTLSVRIGWRQPAGAAEATVPDRRSPAPGIEPIPPERFICGWGVEDARRERRNAVLRPDFTFELGEPYSFRGHSAVFTPVEFHNLTAAPGRSNLVFRWQFGDGGGTAPQSAGGGARTDASHVYTAAGRYHATLAVLDPGGFAERASRFVDCRLVDPGEYAADFRLSSLPPVCYDTDPLHPVLEVVGRGPDGAQFEVWWRATMTSGDEDGGTMDLALSGKTHFLSLPKARAADLDTLEWSVSHRDVPLASTLIRFVRPPFKEAPAYADGDRLYDEDGTQLVLVPARVVTESGYPVVSAGSLSSLLVFDDILGPRGRSDPGHIDTFASMLGRSLGKAHSVSIEHVPVPEWRHSARALGALLKLTQARRAAADAEDLVVLSVGRQDAVAGRTARQFERDAAALSDIVGSTFGRPLLWLTPPPYPFDPRRFRAYAAAVRRVADARKIPVADLYTSFSCAGDEPDTFFRGRDMELSQRGLQLAADTVARALKME